MKPNPKKVLADALKLEPSARALIAESLLESLDAEIDADLSQEWASEIERRCQEIDNGTVALLDGDTVMAELRAKYSE